MWIENKIYFEDLKSIIDDKNIDWKLLSNKNIYITGATGLIGRNLVNAILYANMNLGINCTIYAHVRNIEKARMLFESQASDKLKFIVGDIQDEINCDEKIDYIIHAASQTASKKFIEDPVSTIDIAINGTRNVLNLAKKNNVDSFVYLSTMEVYGRPQTDEKIDEKHSTDLNTMDVRNCYPISKRMCENLCACYNVNSKVIRLTQTFGPGVEYNDGRVFAEFARCAIENRDIVLHTTGETKRSYLYTADAIRAIFTILLKGKNNEIYNVANEETYCSILEMANLVKDKCTDGKINVNIEIEDINKFGYIPKLCMNLDTTKIQELGWKPKVNLENIYKKLISSLRRSEK